MTKKKFAIYQNGKKLFDYGIYIFDSIQINYMLQENKYEAGDTFKIYVQYDWGGQMASRDFSVIIYSQQNLEIKDLNGQTNMLHYDGNSPSGLKQNPLYESYEPI
jgi:hypothetical protein